MKKRFYFVTILFVALCIACQNENENEDDTPIAPLPDAEPIALHIQQKVTTDNTFAFDIFKATPADSKEANVFISPLSISMALNMVINGAASTTLDEILEALSAKNYTVSDINEHSRLLRSELTSVDPSTEFSIANSIWYRQGFPVKDAFLEVNRANYAAEVNALDFSSSNAVKQINSWCAEQTNNKIKTVIDKISPETMMYLINAVYFKGIWASKFDKNNTRNEDFHASDGNTNQVQMMRQTANFNYGTDEYGEYLELPYGNKAFSMIVILPQEDKTTENIIEHLNSERWNSAIDNMYGGEINLSLPRFKSECEYKLHENILPELGMRIPFTEYANFSNISDIPLCISGVIHKTFVEVNEEGTEAAAVTSIGMDFTTSVEPSQPIDFIVNKPFVFVIREKSSGVILFMGKIGEIE